MKPLLNKLLFFSTGILLCIVCSSWDAASYSNRGLTEYLEKMDLPSSSVSNESVQKKINDFLLVSGMENKKNSGTHIIYRMHQSGSPYLDANLKISIDGVEKVFAFTDVESDFYQVENLGSYLDVECPIFDQWEDIGRYHLVIIGFTSFG